MTSIEAPPITAVQPGGGPQGDLGTIVAAVKLWGRDTGGALEVVGRTTGCPRSHGASRPPEAVNRPTTLRDALSVP